MLLKSTVPSVVPSLVQTSRPLVPSSALKNSLPPTAANPSGGRSPRSGPDVPEEDGSDGGAIANPGLRAIRIIVSAEDEPPVDGGEPVRERTVGPKPDVLNEEGPGRRTVARPEFRAVGAV